jgi:hypothetical protein
LQSMQSQDVDGPERPDTDSFTNISENNDLDISSQREKILGLHPVTVVISEFNSPDCSPENTISY